MKKIIGLVLLALGAYMIYLGTKGGIVPPTITGIGFIAIAVVFFNRKEIVRQLLVQHVTVVSYEKGFVFLAFFRRVSTPKTFT